MNWDKLKANLPSIIYLSVIQTIINFTFPVYQGLGTVFRLLLSIACICGYILIFMNAHKYEPMQSDIIDGQPDNVALVFHAIRTVVMILSLMLSVLFLWYIDYFKMAVEYYLLLGAHTFIAYALFYKASEQK